MDDFTTVIEELRRSDNEEAKRDRYRLEQATGQFLENSNSAFFFFEPLKFSTPKYVAQ